MLKVLIVEDEDFERRALKFLVKKYFSTELQIVGEASNGQEAIDRTLVLKPDLILMDINMPIMDGLKASKIIKKLNKHIEILILTAYDTFVYAQEALKCGVSDYLVKPFTNEDFLNAISTVITNIRMNQTIISKQVQLDKSFKEAILFIEKKAVAKIAYGNQMSIEELEESIEMLKINSNNGCCLLLGCVDNYSFKEKSLQCVKSILSDLCSQVIGARFLGDMVFFIFDAEVENIVSSEKMKFIINKIKRHFVEYEDIDVNIQIGPVAKDTAEYNWSYNQAKAQLRGENKQISFSDYNGENKFKHINDQENIILSKIVDEDLEGALQETELLLKLIQSKDKNLETIKEDTNFIVHKLINDLSDFIEADRRTVLSNYIQKKIFSLNDYNDISNYLNIVVKELIEDISSSNNISNINIIQSAKEFINNNYMNDIRLEDVAKHVCISSYYFSRIFKKHEGINYIQYLTKVKMEKAKRLIVEGNNSIKEVAMEVGFIDQNYFSRAFKKYTGASPKSFIYSIYQCCDGNDN